MKPIRLLNLGIVPLWQTQAVYHMLAERMTIDTPDTIVICRPSAPHLCLGYHQILKSIFDQEECKRRGLPIFRRRLGGGATYLDTNQLFYQCVFHHSRLPAMLKDIYDLILSAPVKTLNRLGLQARLHDTNEIEVENKRIAGTGGGRIGEACVVVGNLLFDFDFETMTAAWRTPSSSFRFLAEKALQQQLVTLNQMSVAATIEEVTDVLTESFCKCLGRTLQGDMLSAEEIHMAEKIGQRLSSEEFLSLHTNSEDSGPMRVLKISARTFIHADETQLKDYNLFGSFWVNQNVIHCARLESTPAHEWLEAEKELTGIAFPKWQEHIHVQ